MGRTLLAGIVGGLAMFIWSSIAHTVLPLGEMGIKELSGPTAGITAGTGGAYGMYMFPGSGLSEDKSHSEEAQKIMMEKLKTEPSGLLIYHPPGRSSDMGPFLIKEATNEVIQGILLAVILGALAAGTLAKRLAISGVVGVAAALSIHGSYWIWYGFPTSYTIGASITTVVAYLVAGLAIALILGMKKKAPADG